MQGSKRDIIDQLQKDILPLQGYKPPPGGKDINMGLGPIERAFPNRRFPTGAVHEFISMEPENTAATSGFIAGLLTPLMQPGGACLWIAPSRSIFPPALAGFGVAPERIIFIQLSNQKDIAWTMEEALKCEGLAAVVGEIREVDLVTSRRLQLAVEHSRVTGLILRHRPRNMDPIACVARWQITPLASQLEDNTPGVGFPRWQVELLKVRNGSLGKWNIEWSAGRFHTISQPLSELTQEQKRKAG